MKHKKRKTGCSWYVLRANEVVLSAGKLSEIPTRDHILTCFDWFVAIACLISANQKKNSGEESVRRLVCGFLTVIQFQQVKGVDAIKVACG